MAQRKFLRQLSGYTNQLDPYPRIFIADLNYDTDEDVNETDIVVDELQPGRFCIKLMCEHEKVRVNASKD